MARSLTENLTECLRQTYRKAKIFTWFRWLFGCMAIHRVRPKNRSLGKFENNVLSFPSTFNEMEKKKIFFSVCCHKKKKRTNKIWLFYGLCLSQSFSYTILLLFFFFCHMESPNGKQYWLKIFELVTFLLYLLLLLMLRLMFLYL